MDNSRNVVIELRRGSLLPLRDSRGARVVCLEGALWITEEDDRNDVVLHPGEAHAIEHDGNTLVQAVDSARIAVENPVELRLAA